MPYPRPAPRSRFCKSRLLKKEEMPVSNMAPCISLGTPGFSWNIDCDSEGLSSEAVSLSDYKSHSMPVGRFDFSCYSEDPGYSCHSETVTNMDDAPFFPRSHKPSKVEQHSIIVDQTTGFSYCVLGEPVRSPGKKGKELASASSCSSAIKGEAGRKSGGEENVSDILDQGTALVEDDAHLLMWLEQEWGKGYEKDLFNVSGTLSSQFSLNREIENYLESISRNSDATCGAYGDSFVDTHPVQVFHCHTNGTCDASLLDCPSQSPKLADYNSNEIFENNAKERETKSFSYLDCNYDIFSNDLFSYPGMSDASTFDTSGSSSTTLVPTNDGCPILRQRLSVSAESAQCLPVGVKDQCGGAVHVEFQTECNEWLSQSEPKSSVGFQVDASKGLPDFKASGIGVYSDSAGLLDKKNAAIACFSVGAGLPLNHGCTEKSAYDPYESQVYKSCLPPPLSSFSVGSSSTCSSASELPFTLSPSLSNRFSSSSTVTLVPVQAKMPEGPKHILSLPEALKQGLRTNSMIQVPHQVCTKTSNYSVKTSSPNSSFSKSSIQKRQSPIEISKENELEVIALDSPKLKKGQESTLPWVSPRHFNSLESAVSRIRASTRMTSHGDYCHSQKSCAKSQSFRGINSVNKVIRKEKTFTLRQHLKSSAESSSDKSQKDKNECQEWVKIFRKVNTGPDANKASELMGKNVGKELYENSESGVVIQFSSPPTKTRIDLEKNESTYYRNNRIRSKKHTKTNYGNIAPRETVVHRNYEGTNKVEDMPLEVKSLMCKEPVVVLRDLYSGKKQKTLASTSVGGECSSASEIIKRVHSKRHLLKSKTSSGSANTSVRPSKLIKSSQKTAEKNHEHTTQKKVDKSPKKGSIERVNTMDPIEFLKEEGIRNMWKHVMRLKSLMLNAEPLQSSSSAAAEGNPRVDNKVDTSSHSITRRKVVHCGKKLRKKSFKKTKDISKVTNSGINCKEPHLSPEIASGNESKRKKVAIKRPIPHRLVKVLYSAHFLLHQSSFLPSACKAKEQKIMNDFGPGKRESLHRSCKLPLQLMGYF